MSSPHRRVALAAIACHWTRGPRRRSGRSRGQSLVIFALSLTVLLGLAGLSVDVMRIYDTYAREERAAEAGALAAVMYVPCYYNSATSTCGDGSTSPDGNSATARAMQEVYRNGFGTLPSGTTIATPCPASGTQEVTICHVSGKSTDVQVTVTETINIFLLSVVGITSTTVSASAQAEYLPPIQMGSRTAYFGDQAECSAPAGACDMNNAGVTHLQNFRAVTNGPGDLKEYGDPYVYCEEGPSLAPPGDTGGPYPTYVGGSSNHPQYASPNCGVPGTPLGNVGNPDQQPLGYCGPATCSSANHPGAKNYAITVDTVPASIWVYNAPYDPSDLSGWSRLDHFQNTGQTKYGSLTFAGGHFDDNSMYFNTTYALYQTPSTYVRSTDVLVSQATYSPYDMMTADLNLHCPGQSSVAYDLSDHSSYSGRSITAGDGCIPLTNPGNVACIHAWCQIATVTTAGSYRLTVETAGVTNSLQGWGSKQYALKICGPGTFTPTTLYGCATGPKTTLAAWNNMTVFYAAPSQAADFDLAYIPPSYAGRTISIDLFDPGDSSGNVYMEIIPPASSGVTITYATKPYPTGIRTGTDPGNGLTGILASSGGDTIYNARWIKTPVVLPATYPGGWWTIHYNVSNGTPSDTVTIAFDIVGSPVHLVTLG